MQISNVAHDTIMIFDGFTHTLNGVDDYSSWHFGGPTDFGCPGSFGAKSIGIMSHNQSGAVLTGTNATGGSFASTSIGYADGHAETVFVGTLLSDPKYCVAVPPIVPSVLSSGNLGRYGDFQLRWNNSNGPYGYWTGTPDD